MTESCVCVSALAELAAQQAQVEARKLKVEMALAERHKNGLRKLQDQPAEAQDELTCPRRPRPSSSPRCTRCTRAILLPGRCVRRAREPLVRRATGEAARLALPASAR